MNTTVAVIGGGPGGAACAIELASLGVDVVLVERSPSATHKLCGEFVSGEVRPLLDRLAVTADFEGVGAVGIGSFRITAPSGAAFEGDLPDPAVGISRIAMDGILRARAEAAGAKVLRGCEVVSISGGVDGGYRVGCRGASGRDANADAGGEEVSSTISTRFVVGAWGRWSRLDRALRPEALAPTPWVAFKGHYRGGDVGSFVELHCFPGGYCGLSHVEDGVTNVCWIMHRDALRSSPGGGPSEPWAPFAANEALSTKFAGMVPLYPRPLSVSQLTFAGREPFIGEMPLVGDAAGMIAPLCGDGMSMALISGVWMGSSMAAVIRGERGLSELRGSYRRLWSTGFARRMRLGQALHRLLTRPVALEAAIRLFNVWRAPATWMVAETRGLPRGLHETIG